MTPGKKFFTSHSTAQGSQEVTFQRGISQTYRYDNYRHSLVVGLAMSNLQLDFKILKVFFNLKDSMITCP